MIIKAINPLRMIFWGGLLCLLDLSFGQTRNGTGFKFDILNDAVGALLIYAGVSNLSSLPVHDRYTTAMSFVKVVAALSILDALRAHFVTPYPAPVLFFLQIFGFVTLAAMITFCVAMQWLSISAQLAQSEASWRTTTILFVAIYAIPLGISHVLSIFSMTAGKPFHINLGPAGLLLLPIFLIPIVHFFVSTSRMKNEAELQLHAP